MNKLEKIEIAIETLNKLTDTMTLGDLPCTECKYREPHYCRNCALRNEIEIYWKADNE